MAILDETIKKGDHLVSDINIDSFLHGLGLPFFVNKAVETLLEHDIKTDEVDTILNSIRYLVAQLELNNEIAREQWIDSDVINYIKQKI